MLVIGYTISGSRRWKSFIYSRNIILREIQPPSPLPLGTKANSTNVPAPIPIPNPLFPHQHIVRCCHCPKVWVNLNPEDTNSSMFQKHVQRSHPEIPRDGRCVRICVHEERLKSTRSKKRKFTSTTLDSDSPVSPWTIAAQGSCGPRFTQDQFRQLLVKFLIDTNSSFSLVESESFQSLVEYLNPAVKSVSRRTITRDLLHLHTTFEPRVISLLADVTKIQGRIHLTLDA